MSRDEAGNYGREDTYCTYCTCKWTRQVTVLVLVISWISSCGPPFFYLKPLIHIPLSGAAQFQAPTIMGPFDRDLWWFPDKGGTKYMVKRCHCLFLCMDVRLFHIHWSNSSPAPAEVEISAYHSILPAIQRLLVSWRCKAYLTSKRHDRQEPGPRPAVAKLSSQ